MRWLKRKVIFDYNQFVRQLYKGHKTDYNFILDCISAIEYGPQHNDFLEKAMLMHG